MADVLVVEDHRDSAEPLISILHKAGYTVMHVLDGRDALAALSDATPRLIVLDLRLPILDGAGFLSVMRSYLRWKDIPVLVVTAGNDEEIDRVQRLGVRRVFRKAHYQLNDFMNAVEELLGPTAASAAQ